MAHIVVVANQTIGGANLLDYVRHRAEEEDTSFTLIVPMTKPRSGYVIYEDAVRGSAQVRVDLALSFLHNQGINVSGEIGDEDPYTATLDAVREYQPDEVVVSTLPATTSGWLRRDLIERIEQDAGVPVQHIVSDVEGEGLPFNITVVVANQTVADAKLVERMKAKDAETDNQVFILVMPLPDGEGKAAAIGRARLGNTLERLRREKLLVAGMLGDPDPYTATMNALQYFNVHDLIISTLPETRSGWLREDLVARVRKASELELEHVVTDRERTEA